MTSLKHYSEDLDPDLLSLKSPVLKVVDEHLFEHDFTEDQGDTEDLLTIIDSLPMERKRDLSRNYGLVVKKRKTENSITEEFDTITKNSCALVDENESNSRTSSTTTKAASITTGNKKDCYLEVLNNKLTQIKLTLENNVKELLNTEDIYIKSLEGLLIFVKKICGDTTLHKPVYIFKIKRIVELLIHKHKRFYKKSFKTYSSFANNNDDNDEHQDVSQCLYEITKLLVNQCIPDTLKYYIEYCSLQQEFQTFARENNIERNYIDPNLIYISVNSTVTQLKENEINRYFVDLQLDTTFISLVQKPGNRLIVYKNLHESINKLTTKYVDESSGNIATDYINVEVFTEIFNLFCKLKDFVLCLNKEVGLKRDISDKKLRIKNMIKSSYESIYETNNPLVFDNLGSLKLVGTGCLIYLQNKNHIVSDQFGLVLFETHLLIIGFSGFHNQKIDIKFTIPLQSCKLINDENNIYECGLLTKYQHKFILDYHEIEFEKAQRYKNQNKHDKYYKFGYDHRFMFLFETEQVTNVWIKEITQSIKISQYLYGFNIENSNTFLFYSYDRFLKKYFIDTFSSGNDIMIFDVIISSCDQAQNSFQYQYNNNESKHPIVKFDPSIKLQHEKLLYSIWIFSKLSNNSLRPNINGGVDNRNSIIHKLTKSISDINITGSILTKSKSISNLSDFLKNVVNDKDKPYKNQIRENNDYSSISSINSIESSVSLTQSLKQSIRKTIKKSPSFKSIRQSMSFNDFGKSGNQLNNTVGDTNGGIKHKLNDLRGTSLLHKAKSGFFTKRHSKSMKINSDSTTDFTNQSVVR